MSAPAANPWCLPKGLLDDEDNSKAMMKATKPAVSSSSTDSSGNSPGGTSTSSSASSNMNVTSDRVIRPPRLVRSSTPNKDSLTAVRSPSPVSLCKSNAGGGGLNFAAKPFVTDDPAVTSNDAFEGRPILGGGDKGFSSNTQQDGKPKTYTPQLIGAIKNAPPPFLPVRKPKRVQYTHCVFCKNNGEDESYFLTHSVKDEYGLVSCPVLFAYNCPLCGASGPVAHTIKYCPMNKDDHYHDNFASITELKAMKSSIGKARGAPAHFGGPPQFEYNYHTHPHGGGSERGHPVKDTYGRFTDEGRTSWQELPEPNGCYANPRPGLSLGGPSMHRLGLMSLSQSSNTGGESSKDSSPTFAGQSSSGASSWGSGGLPSLMGFSSRPPHPPPQQQQQRFFHPQQPTPPMNVPYGFRPQSPLQQQQPPKRPELSWLDDMLESHRQSMRSSVPTPMRPSTSSSSASSVPPPHSTPQTASATQHHHHGQNPATSQSYMTRRVTKNAPAMSQDHRLRPNSPAAPNGGGDGMTKKAAVEGGDTEKMSYSQAARTPPSETAQFRRAVGGEQETSRSPGGFHRGRGGFRRGGSFKK